ADPIKTNAKLANQPVKRGFHQNRKMTDTVIDAHAENRLHETKRYMGNDPLFARLTGLFVKSRNEAVFPALPELFRYGETRYLAQRRPGQIRPRHGPQFRGDFKGRKHRLSRLRKNEAHRTGNYAARPVNKQAANGMIVITIMFVTIRKFFAIFETGFYAIDL